MRAATSSWFMYAMVSIWIIVSMWMNIGCANIVPPSGGRMDTIPPKLLRMTPADSSLQIRPKRIELTFDKYMVVGDVAKDMTISPLLPINPMVTAQMKKVFIDIQDTMLEANTTYVISLGNTLKDNREGTAAAPITISFSTGDYFDSLTLKGTAYNAATGLPDTGYTAVLYPTTDFIDSTILRKQPLYVTKVDGNGHFEFKFLPNRAFHLFVWKDIDDSKTYTPGKDFIGFMSATVTPTITADTTYSIAVFKEDIPEDEDMDEEEEDASTGLSRRNALRGRNTISFKADEWYRVMVDTVQKEKGSQTLTKPITIHLNKQIKGIDSGKIFLSLDRNGTEIEAISRIEQHDSVLYIYTEWSPESLYTLRLMKGWATDSTGVEAMPGKYLFTTMKKEDYSDLQLQFPLEYVNSGYVYRLEKGKDTIAQAPITDSIMQHLLLEPGEYNWVVIKDDNQDSAWTTGNYLKNIQPEKAWTNNSVLTLRAGWQHQEKFSIKTRTSGIRDRQGARNNENDK